MLLIYSTLILYTSFVLANIDLSLNTSNEQVIKSNISITSSDIPIQNISSTIIHEYKQSITTTSATLSTSQTIQEEEVPIITSNETITDSSTVTDLSSSTSSLSSALSSQSVNSSSSPQPSSSIHNTPFNTSTTTESIPTEIPSTLNNDSIIDKLNTENQQNGFLSFEEWKRQKGVAETIASNNQKSIPIKPVRNELNNPALGEEMEIDLSNFFDQSTQPKQPTPSNGNITEPEGKTYKDKFNYASFDCGATIVKTNSDAKSATSILFENKDTYLLNPCSVGNKYVIIELCQDILVDDVVLGNFEFFSSTFKKIQISVSESYPINSDGWKILGIFEAKDLRDYQSFHIENPLIWANYFKVEILEHYGNEYYCPLSVVRVHGRTMMQEYKQEEAALKQQVEQETNVKVVDGDDVVVVDVEVPISSPLCQNYTSGEIIKCDKEDTSITKGKVLGQISDLNFTSLEDLNFNECLVSLPQLKFEEFFNQFQNSSQCEPIISTIPTTNIPSSSSTTPQNHGTQESIYKNIMKRLSLLEANATLSVLYIEEQSKLLSNAFSSLEKTQSVKLENLINFFNNTIHQQLFNIHQFSQLFQNETINTLTKYTQYQDLLLDESNSKIDSLSVDLKFQKILSFINGLILFMILIYVVLTRDTYIDTEYVENDKVWLNLQKRKISTTSSKIRANFDNLKKFYYNSDTKSESEEEEEEDGDGRTTPSSNELNNDVDNTSVERNELEKLIKRPLTPDHSDKE